MEGPRLAGRREKRILSCGRVWEKQDSSGGRSTRKEREKKGQQEKFYEKATGGRNLPGERTRGRQEIKKRTLRKRIWRKRR